MYHAKIVTEAGKTFQFGYEHGVLFDITHLTGLDVSIGRSQGINQIGETIENQSVGAINRTIKGIILEKEKARQMLKFLPAFTSGKLYVNDAYFCEIVVNRTPEISFLKNGKMPFTMRVLCAYPYWKGKQESVFVVSGLKKSFSFPVTYDSHIFATESDEAFVNCYNDGDVQANFVAEFTTSVSSENYGIVNINTLQELRFNDTLNQGEKTRIFFENGKIKATKQDASGNVVPFLGAITDESSLFSLNAGDNVLKSSADVGQRYLKAVVSFFPSYMGVVP